MYICVITAEQPQCKAGGKNPNVNAIKYYLRKDLYIDSIVDISVHTCFPLGKYSTLNQ